MFYVALGATEAPQTSSIIPLVVMVIILTDSKGLNTVCLPAEPLRYSCFTRFVWAQEYNIHGWWVGELRGTVGIVPKDFLHPAYIL